MIALPRGGDGQSQAGGYPRSLPARARDAIPPPRGALGRDRIRGGDRRARPRLTRGSKNRGAPRRDPAGDPHQSSRGESKARSGINWSHIPASTVRGTHRRRITAVSPAILKKRRKTPRRGDYWRLFLEERAATRAAARRLVVSFLLRRLSIRFSGCPLFLPLALLVVAGSRSRGLALTSRTAERRIGSLNKMTRLFIGAFVRVKVGTAFLSGA